MRQDNLRLRLRLVIQRHELPEVRIIFSCKIDNDPTVAGLLEQVNEVVPLESRDWGLEDYAVELRKENGAAFDCLHFQEVADVLSHDEEVFIRPLVTEDRRKRRLSGRDQISIAGRHLIDGIPFGRPRLRAPRDRPPIEIPSLKRPRSEYEQDDDDYEEEEESDEYERQLFITDRGEPKRQRRGNVRFSEEFLNADQDDEDDADFDGEDEVDEEDLDSEIEEEVEEDRIAEAVHVEELEKVEEEEEEEEDDDEEDIGENQGISEEDDGDNTDSDNNDDDISDVDESELEDELQALLEDNKEVDDDFPEHFRDAGLRDHKENSLTNDEKIIALSTAFPRLSIADCTEALHQQGMDLAKAYLAVRENHLPTSGMDAVFKHCKSLEGQRTLDLDVLDKITALQAAFKGLDIDVIQDVLTKQRYGLIASYNKLREYRSPRKELRDMLAHYQSLRMPTAPANQPPDQDMDAVEDGEEDAADDDDGPAGDSDAESVDSVVKHYDEHGFPSGSILDGTASRHMVEEMRKAGKAIALPVHIKFGESDDEDIGSADGDINFEDKADPSHVESLEEDAGHSKHDSKSNSGGDSGDDSGPEVASSKKAPEYPRLSDSASSSELDDFEDSDEESDDNDEESDDNDGSNSESGSDKGSNDGNDGGVALDGDRQIHGESGRGSDGANDNSHSESSDESSDNDFEEAEKENDNTSGQSSADSDSDDSSASSAEDSDDSDEEASSEFDSSSDDDSSSADSSSDDSSSDDQGSVSEDDTGIRKEKNFAASGPTTTKNGDLVVPKSAPVPEARPVPPGQGRNATRKRNARRKKARLAAARGQSVEEPEPLEQFTPQDAQKADDAADITETIAAKKAAILQRLNGIHGLLAQGLGGNAKNTQDKPQGMGVDSRSSISPQRQTKGDSVRSTLTSDIRPLDSENQVQEQDVQPDDVLEEDPDAWRQKINYRAVECCHEGVELSEPPFPFVQRWDPQQQYYHKDNKRGGRSKRKQRNQADFQDDNRSSVKRRKHDDGNWEDQGEDEQHFYDDSAGYGNSTLNYDDSTTYGETRLNYDDEPQQAEEGDWGYEDQDDEEDLPPLPDDVSSLPPLEAGRAMAGMILTWKQLLMSKATNWQPQVTSLTAIIVNVEGDGVFRVRLAKRDQNLDQNEKVYDEDGNRVYDKFEMVDLDEENDEEAEQGYRTVELAEMIEPRVLQYPDNVIPDTPSAPHSPGAPPTVEEDADKLTSFHTSATLGRSEVGKQDDDPSQMEVETQPVSESVIPESALRSSNEQRLSQTDPAPVDDIPMTEERRSEISQLINEAGFRKDVDPSIAITEVANSDGSSNSPSRQLEDMSHDVLAAFKSSQAQNHPKVRSSQVTTNGVDSQPIFLEPFNGFSDCLAPPSESRVEYPKLLVPTSDAGSIQSGRQPDPDFSMDLGDSSFNHLESRSPALQNGSEAEDQATPKASQSKRARSVSESSNDSFPSLSELPTSSANRNTSTPPKSNAKSDAANKKRAHEESESEDSGGGLFVDQDDDYENSGSDLDEDDGNEDSEDDVDTLPSTLARKLVQKPIEKPSPKKALSKGTASKRNSTPFIKAETSSYPQRSTHESIASSRFRIPEGSQVVSLLTSSPEPEVVENYAEDDIDETYKDSGADEEEEQEEDEEASSSLPRGSGWVKKKKAKKNKGVAGRGMSVPASSLGPAREKESVPKRFASSQATSRVGRGDGGESSQKAYAGLMKARNKLAANRFGRF